MLNDFTVYLSRTDIYDSLDGLKFREVLVSSRDGPSFTLIENIRVVFFFPIIFYSYQSSKFPFLVVDISILHCIRHCFFLCNILILDLVIAIHGHYKPSSSISYIPFD